MRIEALEQLTGLKAGILRQVAVLLGDDQESSQSVALNLMTIVQNELYELETMCRLSIRDEFIPELKVQIEQPAYGEQVDDAARTVLSTNERAVGEG